MNAEPSGSLTRTPLFLLYFNVLVIATCGLIYELLAGTLASYVLGDSVTQFSLVIGVYLSALGVGAWLSRFVKRGLARCFLEVELGVALIGGCSAPLLFLSFAYLSWFQPLLFLVVFMIGVLVGLELPLLMRILESHLDFSDLISRVLAFDYLGALFASVLFPLLLVPKLGLVRTSLAFGILNALVGLWGTWLLRPLLASSVVGLRLRALLCIALLVVGIWKADRLTTLAEEGLFSHPVVYAETTPYQRIVVTRAANGFQLFLNGNLQFHAADEYRYHEALVHPACAVRPDPSSVLVLGGGDGLAVRELLKYPTVKDITLVDIDPAMTRLAREFGPLRTLNAAALHDPRVAVVAADAYVWLGQESLEKTFDTIIIDFPDPNSFALGKLYTTRFFGLLRRHLTDDAVIAMQCTSPLIARKSYWCIVRTWESAGFTVRPYHATVPSFGEWGYVLARVGSCEIPTELAGAVQGQTRFLSDQTLPSLFSLPADMNRVEVEINRLDNQMLVHYYEQESRPWN
ncbi:MAG: polyamine aminopropyltransferase [Planctomycetota bacterium]